MIDRRYFKGMKMPSGCHRMQIRESAGFRRQFNEVPCPIIESITYELEVVGEPELFAVEVIESFCRFTEYDRSDLDWAVPLKLCRITSRPLHCGDVVEGAAFNLPQFSKLVCVDVTTVHRSHDSWLSGSVALVAKFETLPFVF